MNPHAAVFVPGGYAFDAAAKLPAKKSQRCCLCVRALESFQLCELPRPVQQATLPLIVGECGG